MSTARDSDGGGRGGEVYGLMWNGALAVHSLLFSGITPFGGMVTEAVASGGGVPLRSLTTGYRGLTPPGYQQRCECLEGCRSVPP